MRASATHLSHVCVFNMQFHIAGWAESVIILKHGFLAMTPLIGEQNILHSVRSCHQSPNTTPLPVNGLR